MSRLFVGQRENDFFADITKEVIKDVAGQKIFSKLPKKIISR